MFNKLDRTKSRQGEDKIRGLLGWLSYLDKLYKVRKYKVNSKLDRDIPVEHYFKAAVSSFFAGLLLWGYPVVAVGTLFYFRQFRRIKVTDKLFRSVFLGVGFGSSVSLFIVIKYLISEGFLFWLARLYGKTKGIIKIGDVIANMINDLGLFLLNVKECIGTVYLWYLISLVAVVISYLTSHKIKEHYN